MLRADHIRQKNNFSLSLIYLGNTEEEPKQLIIASDGMIKLFLTQKPKYWKKLFRGCMTHLFKFSSKKK